MTNGLLLRLAILVGVGLAAWLSVALTRAYAAARKRQALAAVPGDAPLPLSDGADIRILAFSSEDCSPCHTLQRPALNRLVGERPGQIEVVEIDAPTSPELTKRYAVLTVPTTVVLDATGRAHAVNYGFAPFGKLLDQVDEALGAQAASA